LSLLTLFSISHAKAADFTCLEPPALGRLVSGPRPLGVQAQYPRDPDERAYIWEGKDKDGHGCWRVAIEGKITSGDADKLESLLTSSPPFVFLLQSPGGNLLEAMTMGRLLRASFASIETKRSKCGGPNQAVCCASACALVYLGAARRKPGDLLGLHRPTLEDLGEKEGIITLTKQALDMVCEQGQAGAIEGYKGRGVFVPHGLKASWIMEGAWLLEREFDVVPYTSREMVISLLEELLPLLQKDGILGSTHLNVSSAERS
jgi:hypothetical protein